MVTLYIGDNTLDRDKELNKHIKSFIKQYGDMATDNIKTEDSDVENIIDAITTVPLFSSKKLVVIRHLSTNRQLVDEIDTIISRVADSTELVLVESSLDKRSIYAK